MGVVKLQVVMEAGEVEFLAEKELVTITPNFSENKITLISVRSGWGRYRMIVNGILVVQGQFGPFNPSMHCQVPLWLAINLKQRHKCRIEPPEWLSAGQFLYTNDVSLCLMKVRM